MYILFNTIIFYSFLFPYTFCTVALRRIPPARNPREGVLQYRKKERKKERKLEMVQRRAARYATNRYHNTSSVSEMLDHLNWETLESRRTKAQLTMMFRIVNSLVDVPLEQYLTPASSRTRSAHSHKFRQISTTTSYYKNSFFPRTIITWNSLSPAIAEAPDLVSFKQGLSTLKF